MISETMQPHDGEGQSRLTTFDQYRGLLFSIAYRMLGSVADAEDMLQETFIRWQQASDMDIRSPRAVLVTIISRLCINHLQSARIRREKYVGQWLPEPLVTNLGDDSLGTVPVDETLSMAFLVLLERLTPAERAVFLLREIFDYEYVEIATVLGQSQANCRQILRRARQHVSEVRPRFRASTKKRDALLQRFLQATGNGDLGGLVVLLSRDVVLHSDGGGNGPAVPNLIHGADRVARAILSGLRKLLPKDLVRRMAQINGEPGFISYLNGKPYCVLTMETTDEAEGDTQNEGHIRAIYVLTNPEKLAHLPDLPAVPC